MMLLVLLLVVVPLVIVAAVTIGFVQSRFFGSRGRRLPRGGERL